MIDKGLRVRQGFFTAGQARGDSISPGTSTSGGMRNAGGGGDNREQRRTEQYTSQKTKDLTAGVGSGGEGTLADPREKQDYFGSTVFGPSRKYTGSFLDNILSGGYRAVQPYAPDQFQSRFQQMGGGKGILSSLLGLVNPALGIMSRVINAAPGEFKRFQSSPTLADYFGGFNFGAKNISDVYANQGRGSGLRNTGIMTMPMQNIDPYKYSIGPRPVKMPQYFENINTYEEPDFYSDAMADAYTTPTMGQYGLNLMQLNTLKNAGYSNSQIEEAVEKGYADELVRDIKGPIGIV
jgi:hypothetical protein